MQNPLSNVSDVLDLKPKKSVLHTASPSDVVFDAVREMNQHQVGAVVVVENERVVGIFTERDVLVRIVAADLDPHATLVSQVMTPDPICVTRSKPASAVMTIAREKRCRHFPVVEDDRLMGLISIGDLIHLASQDQASRIDASILAMRAVSGR
jgi:CBS domain-containing protein